MSNTSNSLTTLIQDLIKLQSNGLEMINKLSDVVGSNADTVELNILDENNITKKILIPSFGKLQSQIDRLDTNVQNLAGLGTSNSVLKLSDNSFRKVLQDTLSKEAKSIESITVPGEFNSRANWFFESFLNPLLYISFDFGSQIKADTERVEVSRYILNLDSEAKIQLFNQKWKGKDGIVFDNFIDDLLANDISFMLDEDTVDLPPRDLRYNGLFSILRIHDTPVETEVDGETLTSRDLRFKLDKLTYSDRNSRFEDTQQIKVGDSLIINNENRNTRYKITKIDEGTNTISVELLEGFDKVGVGADVLEFFGDDNVANDVQVNIGFNERTVVFIKPIDPDSKIKALNWSPGVGFYSNELTITDDNDTKFTLEEYYKNEVVDFGAFIFSMSKENIPPSILGIEPDAPNLIANNFKTVQINKHITDSPEVKEITQLHQDRQKIDSEIKQLDVAIQNKRVTLNTKKFKSKVEKDSEKNELSVLIEEKASKSKLYVSIINDINAKIETGSVTDITPSYRLRGFWPFPEPKTSDKTNPQEVVQFVVQYRYVTKDGGANQAEQIEFTENDGTVRRGSFSTWNEYITPVRKREEDKNGNIIWSDENVESSDIPNINQLDLPIREGEGIEFRIKSRSEAGWPTNPKESVYTEIFRVDFPDDLEAINELNDIVEQTKAEAVRVNLIEELNSRGVDQHVSSSFTANETYFAHSSLDLASGFTTTEQIPISLFEKLQQIDQELASLRDLITKAKGKLVVKIVNENGEEITVQDKSVVGVRAENYQSSVSSLSIKKGVIVTKTYFLKIQNDAASDLELYSKIFGSKSLRPRDSFNSGATSDYISGDDAYNIRRRYDFVPIALSNPKDTNDLELREELPYQSSQVKGQFFNIRYKDIDGQNILYSDIDANGNVLDIDGNIPTSIDNMEYSFSRPGTPSTANSASEFIWDPANNSETDTLDENSFSYNNFISIHEDHPNIATWIATGNATAEATKDVRQSKYAKLQSTETNGKKQSAYFYDSSLGRTVKTSFIDDDQYLLGPNSCGAYLFLVPQKHEDIIVDGVDEISKKLVKFGSSDAITIPIVFQYRMTDYFGNGDSGTGLVGGDINGNIRQLIYNKTIGIDIFHGTDEVFSFDLSVAAQYRSRNLEITDLPVRSFQNAIDDLNNTVSQTSSEITE